MEKHTKDAKRAAKVLGLGEKKSIFGEKASRCIARLKKKAQSARLGQLVAESPDAHLLTRAQLDKLPPASTLAALRKTATQLERKTRGKQQKRDKASKEELLHWQTNNASLRERVTGLVGPMCSFDLMPGLQQQEGFIAEMTSSARGSTMEKLVATLGAATKDKQNLTDALLRSFELKCRTVIESEAKEWCPDAVPATEAGPQKPNGKPPCWQCRICICKGEGLLVWRLLQRLLACLKLVFPTS